MSVQGDFYESEPSATVEAHRGGYYCCTEDLERLDELIARYLPVALSAEEDFDRALKAAHLTIELIAMQTTLLESYLKGAQ